MIHLDTILFPTDFSEASKIALPFAADLSDKYDADLHIFHAFSENILNPYFLSEEVDEAARYFERVEEEFDNLVEELVEDIDLKEDDYTEVLANGEPFVEMINYIREKDVDLVVMSTHGRTGISHMLLGSTTEKVVRKATCPVLSIRNPDFEFEMP